MKNTSGYRRWNWGDRKALNEMQKYILQGVTTLTSKNDGALLSLNKIVALIDRFNGAGVNLKNSNELEFDTTSARRFGMQTGRLGRPLSIG